MLLLFLKLPAALFPLVLLPFGIELPRLHSTLLPLAYELQQVFLCALGVGAVAFASFFPTMAGVIAPVGQCVHVLRLRFGAAATAAAGSSCCASALGNAAAEGQQWTNRSKLGHAGGLGRPWGPFCGFIRGLS